MDKEYILYYLKKHKDIFEKKYGVIKIGLFGSYAKDLQHKDSDIDIAIEMAKDKKNLKNFFAFKRELEEAFKRRVDLGIESSLKPLVKEHIKKEINYV